MMLASADSHAANATRRRLSILPGGLYGAEPKELPSVDTQLEHLKSQVFLVILSHYSTYQHRIDVRDDIATVAERIETEPSQTKGLAGEIKQKRSTISLLTVLTKVHAELQGLDQLVDTGELESAAESLVKMTESVGLLWDLSRQTDCPIDVIKAIKKEVMTKGAFLQQKLEELFASAFVFTCHGDVTELKVHPRLLATIEKTFFDSPIKPNDVLNAMAIQGSLASALTRFAKRLLSNFVIPIIQQRSNATVTAMRTKMSSSVMLGAVVKELNPPSASSSSQLSHVFDNLRTLAQFLKEDIFGSPSSSSTHHDRRSGPFHLFAEVWSPLLIHEVVASCLAPSIPDGKDGAHADFVASIENFDRTMKDAGYFDEDQSELTDFVSKIHRHSAEKRRAELLTLVRDILQSEDQNTVQVPGPLERGDIFATSSEVKAVKGENPAATTGKGSEGKDGLEIADATFKLGPCHVSTQAQTLVELAHQTLDEVEETDTSGKIDAFYCARDIFDSYRAVMPVHHGDALENIPARTMLFYNDCEYISFHLLLLGYRYSKNQPYPLNEMGTFLDMVPSFRKMGEGYFRNQMRKQRDKLLAMIAEAEGFHNLVDDVRCEAVEKAIKSTLYHLNGLAKAWRPILPTELYLKSIGMLLDVILQAVLKNMATLGGWTKEEGHQLRYLISLIDKSEAHFHRVTGVGKDKTIEKAPIPKYVTLWEAHKDLVDMLDTASADTIQQRIQGALEHIGGTATAKTSPHR
ncbi:hypothetical protein PhCBS80983_g05687 [Powellomyces hirtus]|uniref:Centromere/kinetochore protein zw10 n=1 Tax=Powellomyces hirtus TaxID=109895 RepID=A0A507DTR5_9FUNG|nr:hypothetical protein PhCBS80983_g05687 [Powellomyces hirtus]